MQVTTIPKKTVSVIPPPAKKGPDRSKYDQLRVAPYCRVSTDSEEQLTSYTMQKRVYTEMIMGKPEWQLVDIYADEGISGTRADKRDEFQRMIRDCRRGKIDYIITKSVSRFARNTAECIEFVRQLKLMGIGVIFEEQNIDKFVGKTMLAKLDEDLRIELQFISSHISGQYDTVQMTIINRTEGVVDKQNFKFSDIIGKCIRPGREPLDYHMWEYNNKPEWYTPISMTDKARIADTVMDYAEMYVGQSININGMSM